MFEGDLAVKSANKIRLHPSGDEGPCQANLEQMLETLHCYHFL